MASERIGTERKANIFFTDPRNYLKLMVIFLLGILLVLSIIVLFMAYRSQKRTTEQYIGISDPQAIKTASDTMLSLLNENTFHIVKDYTDQDKLLIVKVDNSSWRKLTVRNRKKFIKDLSTARITVGLPADVKVVDHKTGIELATSEHGRIALAGHDD